MIKLNIGCGPYKKPGYINIDKNPIWEPDKVVDVRNGFPFDDNSVDEIWASHFMEHLDKDEIIFVLSECYKKLKPNGILTIKIPTGVTYDLDHKSFLDKRSFELILRGGKDDYYYGPRIAFSLVEEKRTPKAHGNTNDVLKLVLRKRTE